MRHPTPTARLWLVVISSLVAACQRAPADSSDRGGRPGNHEQYEPADAPHQSILLFAAASTADALDKIRADFTKRHGVAVRTNYASTATLAQQIDSGAAADLFISASDKWAETLQAKGLVAQRRDLLGNQLVLVVPTGSPLQLRGLEDLVNASVRRIALADPSSVPAGIYAQQALSNLKLWDRLRDRVVSGSDVRQTLSFVEAGAADAGIVYATDAAISSMVEVVAVVPDELTDPIRYPVLLLKSGADNQGTKQFFDQLASPESAAVFREFGFRVFE